MLTIETLASKTDDYAQTWSLYCFCKKIYMFQLLKLNQTIPVPGNSKRCPFTPQASWLPTGTYAQSAVTQNHHAFNVSVSSTGISGWEYSQDDPGQRFCQIVWFK